VLGASRRALTAGALGAALFVAACGGHSTTQPATTAAAVIFSFPSADLLIGGVEQASVKVVDANGVTIPGAPVTWTSSAPSIAAVNDSGVVQGLSAGLAVITGASGAASDTATITVDTAGTVVIDSIRPAQLVQGQPATIYGSDFSRFPTGNVVIVGADSITPIAATTTQLDIVIPTAGCQPAQVQQFVVAARGSAAGDSASVAPNVAPVSIGVGQVALLSGTTALSCIQFASANASIEYLIIVGNVTSSLDANAAFLLETQIGTTGSLGFGGYGRITKGAPQGMLRARPIFRSSRQKTALASAPKHSTALSRKAQRVASARRSGVARMPALRRPLFEAWLHAYVRRRLSPFGVAAALSAHMRAITPNVVPAVGDTLTLNVPVSGCDNFKTTQGVVQAVGTHGIVVQDVTAPTGGFATSDFQSISTEFDQFIYPTDTIHFGGPSDIDHNGHVVLYYTPSINSIVETGSDSAFGFVPGFFFTGDLFPNSGSGTTCAESNLGEIIYLAVPDPTGQFGQVLPVDTMRQATRGTVAHEMEHLINAGNRLFKSGGAFEDPWLDEALAHSAEDFVGRAEYGYSDMEEMTFALVDADTGKYAAFFLPNATRFHDWLLAPQSYGAADSRADTSLSVRGAAWSLLRYAEDQYSGGTPATLTRALALGPTTGIGNLQQGAGVPFDSIVEGWLMASYTSGNDSVTVASKYNFLSYNMRDVQGLGTGATYPLVFTPLTAVTEVTSSSIQGNAGNYLQFSAPLTTGVTAGPSWSIVVANGDTTAISFPGARVYLLRIH
jgi:Bacterial Ig-like domain (group 2)